MLVQSVFSTAALCALVSSVVATFHGLPKRPHIEAAPYGTGKAFPKSPPRSRKDICYVKPGKGKNSDDAPAILKAFKKCNKGGTIVLDQKYTIGSPLDLTWLAHVDVVITGELEFKSDPYYWAENSFKFEYQNMSSFWKWGGKDIHIYGDLNKGQSVLNGQGQAYWEEMAVNKTVRKNQYEHISYFH
jgi:galacturan 1,4-alpha-galacturonidase